MNGQFDADSDLVVVVVTVGVRGLLGPSIGRPRIRMMSTERKGNRAIIRYTGDGFFMAEGLWLRAYGLCEDGR
jgi:hypothetical protein